jgi:hypothetical protein
MIKKGLPDDPLQAMKEIILEELTLESSPSLMAAIEHLPLLVEVSRKSLQLMEARPIREGLFGFNLGDMEELRDALNEIDRIEP